MPTMYTATVTAEGGRQGHAASDDGALDVTLTTPKALGGDGGGPGGDGTNPEQLFAAGYAACFQSAMQFIAGQQKIDASGSRVTAKVGIGPNEGGAGFALTVSHHVELPRLSQADAESLVHEAHQVCPYSNATRGNIDVQFTVAGGAQ